MILIAWISFCAIFVGFPGVYYLYMKNYAKRPWKLNIDENFQPSVVIFVPVHNEEKTIRLKLANLSKVVYPALKMQVVIVNDASTDNTLKEIEEYIAQNSQLRISVLDSREHIGKTDCLNRALKSANADIIIISDSDCFWPSNILLKALPYLSDPKVGAITVREWLLNPQGSWVTEGEQLYDNTIQLIRIGESKLHSTIFFQGGFAAYKRALLNEFDQDTDDSGTALKLVQRNSRTLLLPEIGFYTTFPMTWKSKITLKIRRASQLQHLWIKSLKLLLRGKLVTPKRIAIPEIFLHIFNPMVLVVLTLLSAIIFVQWPVLLLPSLVILLLALSFRKARTTVIEVLQNNLILLLALSSFFTDKGFRFWKTVEESRSLLNEAILREKQLI